MDLLEKSVESRIVIVSSNVCLLENTNFGKINIDEMDKNSCLKNYAISKYANVLFAKELAIRLSGMDVTVNVLHPGIVKTKMLDKAELHYRIFFKLFQIFFKTVAEGAQTQIYLAVSEKVKGVSGKYFMACREFDIANGSKHQENGRILWRLSEKLLKDYL